MHDQELDIRSANSKPFNGLVSNYIALNPEKQIKGINVVSNKKGESKLLVPL